MMTSRSRQYLELLSEVERERLTRERSHAEKLAAAGRLDQLWNQLDESEQEAVEKELQEDDVKKRSETRP